MSELKVLIDGCKKRDRVAQRQLYLLFSKKFMSIAFRYGKTKQDAEDILQETFVKIFQHIETVEKESSFESWARRILVNQAINHYHRKLDFNTVDIDDKTDLEEDKVLSVLDDLSNQEIIEVIRKLPNGYRIVLNMSIEGYSHKEIAEQLGINEGTSKSQLYKAKNMLKEFLFQLDVVRV